MKWTWQLSIFGHKLFFKFQTMLIPKEKTWGKCSRIPHTNYHALFLDYDYIDYETLVDELNALIEEFELGNMHVFSLGREYAYHVVCFDYCLLSEVKAIAMSSSCDLGFVLAPRYDKFRNWVLRDAVKGNREKPKYLETVPSPYEGKQKQSKAHKLFVKKYYGVDLPLRHPDMNTVLKFERYLTASRTEADGNGKRRGTEKKIP